MTNQFRVFNVQPVLKLAVVVLAQVFFVMAFGILAIAQDKAVPASFTNNGQPVKIDVQVGQSRVIEFDADYERLAISDEKIAQVIPINFRQAIVNGITFGQVNLVAWAKKKEGEPERLVAFDIYVQTNISLIDNQIKVLFPKENIQLSQVNNSIVLSGSVTKPELADQAQKIIEAAGLKVTNLLKAPVLDAAQVQLQIRVAEVNRQILREVSTAYGFANNILPTFLSPAGPASAVADLILRNPQSPGGGASSASGANVLIGHPNDSVGVQGFVRALNQRGAIRDLAEPTLIAMHGQKASFLAGGEFPIPVIQSVNSGQNTVTIIYKEFGVKLSFTPTIIDENHIRLELEPEVSSLDSSASIILQGFVIPGLRTRRAKTSLELRDGQSFALAGLIDNSEQVSLSKIPLLGDIPILGELFKSRRFQRNETELMFLATVKMVEPLNPDQLPRLPGVSELKPVSSSSTVLPAGQPASQIEGQSGHSVPRKSGEQLEDQSQDKSETKSKPEAKKLESVKAESVSSPIPSSLSSDNSTAANISSTVNPVVPTAIEASPVGPTGIDMPIPKNGKTGKPEPAKPGGPKSGPKDQTPPNE